MNACAIFEGFRLNTFCFFWYYNSKILNFRKVINSI
nr:MAG TPA: hypothetical protein [Bacteriophage sp.]